MRKLFAVLAVAASVSANEVSYRSLQSGSPTGGTPLHDRGIHGQGQIIAILDTGVDYTSCYLAEPDGSAPPFNSGTPHGGLDWENVDLSRRKIVAYDYLYSCEQYPNARGCEVVGAEGSTDNTGHGTHAATTAAGDRGAPLAHDFADAIAPGAQLVVQDGGYIGGDFCSQRPGFGCPVALTPILEQAWKQGARIHSNSWGDMQGRMPPATANYPQSARDVDAFVHAHPDMLVVFNTGNLGSKTATPRSSLSAPGSAKNTLQVGGTRSNTSDDHVLASFTLFGPARDGRVKPDLVAPARVVAGDRDIDGDPATCDDSMQPGTSWASPSVAGAAALVRQYYTDGFYPSGERSVGDGRLPSAALLKATLIAAARQVRYRRDILTGFLEEALPVPSHEQGWGFPVLDDALYFAGDTRKLRVVDVPDDRGLATGETATLRVRARAGTPLRAVLVWTDPPGTVRDENDATPQLVNDLDLRVDGAPATPDRLNNVEVVRVLSPEERVYEIRVTAHALGYGSRQGYALVVTGDVEDAGSPKMRAVRRR